MNQNSNRKVREIIRFAIFGAICFGIEFLVLVALKETLHMDTLLATPIAFLVSTAANYLCCVKWVFHQEATDGLYARIGFLATSAMGLILNELLMLLFRILIGEDSVLFTVGGFAFSMYMLNKMIAALLVMIWNYFTKRAILTSGFMKRFVRDK